MNLLRFDGNQSLAFPTINDGRTFFWVVNRGSGHDVQSSFFSFMELTNGAGPMPTGFSLRPLATF